MPPVPQHSFIVSFTVFIRASVDALCRDGAGEISRDPHTKQLKTLEKSLAKP